jgi:hypothetical protein
MARLRPANITFRGKEGDMPGTLRLANRCSNATFATDSLLTHTLDFKQLRSYLRVPRVLRFLLRQRQDMVLGEVGNPPSVDLAPGSQLLYRGQPSEKRQRAKDSVHVSHYKADSSFLYAQIPTARINKNYGARPETSTLGRPETC